MSRKLKRQVADSLTPVGSDGTGGALSMNREFSPDIYMSGVESLAKLWGNRGIPEEGAVLLVRALTAAYLERMMSDLIVDYLGDGLSALVAAGVEDREYVRAS